MNKQEAIERIKNLYSFIMEDGPFEVDLINKRHVIDIISQIHEPQKVVVPQMIFDVIESFDEDIYHLHEHMSSQPFEVRDWLTHNEREFYEAWLAYPNIVVEKEVENDTDDEEMVNDIFFSWQDCEYESLNECLSDERWKFMQSTGLFDKNGKEIFENDIVEWEHKDTGQLVRGIVKYDTKLGFWGMTDVRFNDLRAIGYLANQKVTVLGNVSSRRGISIRVQMHQRRSKKIPTISVGKFGGTMIE